jgi:mannitol/fructose-specific phosphotransferase system IIA component (Ntr-type)
MQLSELFSPECIKPQLEGTTKKEVFRELISLLTDRYGLCCADEILTAVCEREKKMSTGIREGIAVPHGKSQHLQSIYGALGISAEGIDYDALDGEKVRLVFLIVSSENESEQHLELLKKLALCVEHQEFYEKILKAETPGRINKVLLEYGTRTEDGLEEPALTDRK